ncbi:hypothetical protein BDF14DRAFT_1800771 [Spinellus fusiger]|nr:hypothetical protein BDF14DRAFT_1800771 [Spinellus fusiger]
MPNPIGAFIEHSPIEFNDTHTNTMETVMPINGQAPNPMETPRDYPWTGRMDKDQEQQLKEELIQRATTRLRRRLLEEGLSDVIQQVVFLQTQIDLLKTDTNATIHAVMNIGQQDGFYNSDVDSTKEFHHYNSQIQVFERRLQAHKDQLEQFRQPDYVANGVSENTANNNNNNSPNNSHNNSNNNNISDGADSAIHHPMPPVSSLSMSRLSSLSLVSSLFSRSRSHSNASSASATSASRRLSATSATHATDTTMVTNSDTIRISLSDSQPLPELNTEEEQQRRHRRRRRVRRLRQQYQERVHVQDPLSTGIEWQPKEWESIHTKEACHCVQRVCDPYHTLPIPAPANNAEMRRTRMYPESVTSSDSSMLSMSSSSSLSSPCGLENMADLTYHYFSSDARHPLSPMTPPLHYFDSPSPLYSSHQEWPVPHKTWDCHNVPERNVLDDTLSFLDGLSENGDDGGFKEDIYQLLLHPDLCCRPLSEVEGTINALRDPPHPLSPSALCAYGKRQSLALAQDAVDSSWKWCKFLSVLSASVVVSLAHGPNDLAA